ncbi:MAG: hypothetical protein D3909_12150, partial [Candidatus Electrothrix sp. ATG1]|nr:hypothetical protein [Candidatus Electrothrix sp. ATG1]
MYRKKMKTAEKRASYKSDQPENTLGSERRPRGRRRHTWFDRQRNFFIRQFYADFFTLTYSFQKLYQSYCQCRASAMGSSCYLLHQQGED